MIEKVIWGSSTSGGFGSFYEVYPSHEAFMKGEYFESGESLKEAKQIAERIAS